MRRNPLQRLQTLVRDGRYEISKHALDEALDDNLHRVDLESAVLTGILVRVEKDDPRGVKYVIEGQATDLRTRVGIVARFKSPSMCAIITTYEIKEA